MVFELISLFHSLSLVFSLLSLSLSLSLYPSLSLPLFPRLSLPLPFLVAGRWRYTEFPASGVGKRSVQSVEVYIVSLSFFSLLFSFSLPFLGAGGRDHGIHRVGAVA